MSQESAKYQFKDVINLLELVSGGDDEGDGGDEHHREGEEGEELSQVAENTKC